MIDILEERADKIMLELRKTAEEHVIHSGGSMELLDYNTDTYPGQAILQHTAKGLPISFAESTKAATKIDSRYPSLYVATRSHIQTEVISDTLYSGHNVIAATDHGELTDVALHGLALDTAVYAIQNDQSIPTEKPHKKPYRTGIIASRMIDFIGFSIDGLVVPARDVLGLAFDKIYLPIPSNVGTKTRFERTAMKTYNSLVVHAIKSDMEKRAFSNRRPMLLNHAAPGTVNKYLQGSNTIVVGQINYRIAEFSSQALTWAISTKLRTEASDVDVHPLPLCIKSDVDVEKLAERLIELLQRREPTAKFIYDKDGKLPVERIPKEES